MSLMGSEGSYAASRARVCFAVLAKPLRHLALDKSRQVALEVTATSRKRSVFLQSPCPARPEHLGTRKAVAKINDTLQGMRSLFLRGAVVLIGYMRVSKSDGTQTLSPQRDALLAAGVDPNRIYEDLASGRLDARPGLLACLKSLQPGNTLVIWKLDRLGRDLRHLVTTAEALRERGVGLKVLAGAGAQIDTTTANGRLAFGIFAAFAEFERELIVERTQAGIAAARARGRLGGRPRKMDRTTLSMAMTAMSDRNAVAKEVARRLGITTTTLYAYVNGDGSPKAAGQALLDGIPLQQARN